MLWRADCDPTVLSVAASPTGHADLDAFDFGRFTLPVFILRDTAAAEHLLIGDAGHSLRLDVVDGSVLGGPVQLRYQLADGNSLPARVMTLRRLLALQRLGRFPQTLFPPEAYACRWIRSLQAFDGLASGASHRQIAIALYGADTVKVDWLGRSAYLRCRVQRLLRFAKGLARWLPDAVAAAVILNSSVGTNRLTSKLI